MANPRWYFVTQRSFALGISALLVSCVVPKFSEVESFGLGGAAGNAGSSGANSFAGNGSTASGGVAGSSVATGQGGTSTGIAGNATSNGGTTAPSISGGGGVGGQTLPGIGGTTSLGGATVSGGTSPGGAANGGTAGAATGGASATGGVVGVGGTGVGGKSTTGGATTATGGATTSTGGAATGGAATGGAATGGAATGGAATGGAVTNSGSTVTFNNGRAIGAMTGLGVVAMGSADTVTSPTCGVTQTAITASAPCPTSLNWTGSTALCVTGSIPALPAVPIAADYLNNWGIRVGVNATDPAGNGLGQPFTSISITVIGTPTMNRRAVIHRKGDTEAVAYCSNNFTSGTAIPFTSFVTDCSNATPVGTHLTAADVSTIDQISVQVSSASVAVTVTNLCITGITFN